MFTKGMLATSPKSPMAKARKLMEMQAIVRELKPKIEELKADLLKTVQDLGVLQLKTEEYTISRAKRITPWVTDFDALVEELKKNNIPYGTQVVFADYMSVTFKKLIDDKRVLEGLEGKETEYIMVRVPKKEEEGVTK